MCLRVTGNAFKNRLSVDCRSACLYFLFASSVLKVCKLQDTLGRAQKGGENDSLFCCDIQFGISFRECKFFVAYMHIGPRIMGPGGVCGVAWLFLNFIFYLFFSLCHSRLCRPSGRY